MQDEYCKYDFCKSIGCSGLQKVEGTVAGYKCYQYSYNCLHSAKAFHHWLEEQGYKIVRETDNEPVSSQEIASFMHRLGECDE